MNKANLSTTSILLIMILTLVGCTTPKTVLKNKKTGQIVSCGGNTTSSVTGGALGYYMQKSDDAECKVDYMAEGFEVIKETD